ASGRPADKWGAGAPLAPGCRTSPEWPLAGFITAAWIGAPQRMNGSTRFGQLRYRGRGARWTQQPRGPDDLAAFENAHELRQRQLGIRIGRIEIRGKLRLGGAHRLEKYRKFVFHTHMTSSPGRVERAAALSVSMLRR